MKFAVLATDGAARAGTLELAHGSVETPLFMPVGTYGAVKAVSPAELVENGTRIVLGNTFHLWLRPGLEVIAAHGGLHRFIGWSGPILTDSGGYQVFSLGELRKITEEGVRFASPVNGDRLLLTPEESMRIQRVLNADIVMVFDECTPYPASERDTAESMRLSLRWAERSQRAHRLALHPLRRHQDPQRPLPRRHAGAGRHLPLLHLRPFLARLPAPPAEGERDPRGAAQHRAQPALLPDADARAARRNRGTKTRRHPGRVSRGAPKIRGNRMNREFPMVYFPALP